MKKRICLDCGRDISNLNHQAVRCKSCQKKYRREYKAKNKKQGRSRELFKRYPKKYRDFAIWCSKLPKEELEEVVGEDRTESLIAREIYDNLYNPRLNRYEYRKIYESVEKDFYQYQTNYAHDDNPGGTVCASEPQKEEPVYNDDFKECDEKTFFKKDSPKKKKNRREIYDDWEKGY